MKLRPYQEEASASVWEALKRGSNPCVQLPTGTGKGLLIADLVDRLRTKQGRVWVVTHVKELVAQNYEELDRYRGTSDCGIICAGLNRYEEGKHVTFATIQSLYRPALASSLIGPDAIIIDEAHRIPLGEDGKWYNEVLAAYPSARRIGMTATPWRMSGGIIYGDHEGAWFNELAYAKSVPELVELGFLCPLVGVNTEVQLDLTGVEKNAGDYVMKQVGAKETEVWLDAVVRSVQQLAAKRKHVAVYCPTVEAANNTAQAFTARGWLASVVVGDTTARHEVIDDWKGGNTRVLCSVDVLTTGFNFPALDCIVCLRPTESSSLWCQIMGRATRLYEGKANGLILDYVGNLARLGGIAMMEDYYEERGGKAVGRKTAKGKPKVARPEKPKPGMLGDLDPMSGSSKAVRVRVTNTSYVVIPSKKEEKKFLLMVAYDAETEEGYSITASAFVCTEYQGWAREQAIQFFLRRGVSLERIPYKAETARYLCYGLPTPRYLMVRRNGKYINVVEEHF